MGDGELVESDGGASVLAENVVDGVKVDEGVKVVAKLKVEVGLKVVEGVNLPLEGVNAVDAEVAGVPEVVEGEVINGFEVMVDIGGFACADGGMDGDGTVALDVAGGAAEGLKFDAELGADRGAIPVANGGFALGVKVDVVLGGNMDAELGVNEEDVAEVDMEVEEGKMGPAAALKLYAVAPNGFAAAGLDVEAVAEVAGIVVEEVGVVVGGANGLGLKTNGVLEPGWTPKLEVDGAAKNSTDFGAG